MTTTQNPVLTRYLTELRNGLADVPPADRDEMIREIENHVSEGQQAGRDLASVLETLGPPSGLARAYRVEMLLTERGASPSALTRWFAVIGVAATASIPSLLAVGVLGALGVALTVSGVVVFVAGLASPFVPPEWFGTGFRPLWALLAGPPMTAVGVGALVLLRWYVRFVVRTTRSVWAGRPFSWRKEG